MEPETVMCPTCNVALVDGVCPQCGYRPEAAPTPTEAEVGAPTDNVGAEEPAM